jgi:hypothetical protein
MKSYSIGAGAAILMLFLAMALVGQTPTIGIHEECLDAIDNDSDGNVDGEDMDCYEYPFEDGNGETQTPIEARFTSNYDYEMSIHDYHFNNGYYDIQFYCDEMSSGAFYQAIQTNSNGKDSSYDDWVANANTFCAVP